MKFGRVPTTERILRRLGSAMSARMIGPRVPHAS